MYEWARFIFRLVNGSTDRHLGKPELGGSELLSGKTDTCPPRLRMGRSDTAAFREQETCISSLLSIFGISQDVKHGTNSRPFRCRDSANRPKKVQLLRLRTQKEPTAAEEVQDRRASQITTFRRACRVAGSLLIGRLYPQLATSLLIEITHMGLR